MNDLMTLTKARLSLLVIITTFLGYWLGSPSPLNWLGLLHATLGTALAAASAAVLNQYAEIRVDALMERTRNRPLPAGRIAPGRALVLGIALGVAGCAWLWLAANLLSAALALATILLYVLVYTPLKRRTHHCTVIGAIAGAIPPAIGWTAARNDLSLGAWVLFGVLFTWQMPHFLAIAWMFRDEYRGAGFVMLRPDDMTGKHTALVSLGYTVLLSFITVIPFSAGLCTGDYFAGALLLDAVFLALAGGFCLDRERPSARRLFLASILYLPALLALMVGTKA